AISPRRCSKASPKAAIRSLELRTDQSMSAERRVPPSVRSPQRAPVDDAASADSSGVPTATRKMDARHFAQLSDPFPMYRGGELRGALIAYETWGELNAAKSNAILLFTGLSPSAHARSSPQDTSEGWWEAMIGPGLAIDTNRFFVICVN